MQLIGLHFMISLGGAQLNAGSLFPPEVTGNCFVLWTTKIIRLKYSYLLGHNKIFEAEGVLSEALDYYVFVIVTR